MRSNFRFTLQPSDIALDGAGLAKTIEHIGSDDVILLSTDYPHWDFDDPTLAIKIRLTEAEKRRLFTKNACAVYRLG